MRKLASIKTITNVQPIENKDRIVLVTLNGGWTVVVSKDDFKVNDLCVFCEPDSLLPDRPEFEFLRKRCWRESWHGHRISAMKLGGVISQGIVFPLTILPNPERRKDGEDVTEELKVRKYDPEILLEKSTKKPRKVFTFLMGFKGVRFFYRLFRKLFPKKDRSWPSFIQKTDEERVQNLAKLLENNKGTICYVTEKLDGQSATFALHNKKFIVTSRNIWLNKPDNSNYWQIAKKYDMENRLKKYTKENNLKSIILQGEIVGPGIQGNMYKLPALYFHIFNVFINGVKATTPSDLILYSETLDLPRVPILDALYKLPGTVQEVLEHSRGQATLINTLREGIVIRAQDGSFSFKAINPEFVLKQSEEK